MARLIGMLPIQMLCLACTGLLVAGSVHAQATGTEPAWSRLSPPQQAALKPLEKDWASIDVARKQKWLEVASRFDRMSPEDRTRTQQRMGEWARLSPKERNDARAMFQDARQQLSPAERQERWESYRALPEDQRKQLAADSKAKQATMPKAAARATAPAAGPKINTVANPLLDERKPRPVTPGLSQARAGATTAPIGLKPSPPLHQQTGLPKVTATPEFVDSTTLLPQRGAQGAAAEPRRTR